MSDNEVSLEVYRAFAASKPTEFDAFVRKWREDNDTALHSVLVEMEQAEKEVELASALSETEQTEEETDGVQPRKRTARKRKE